MRLSALLLLPLALAPLNRPSRAAYPGTALGPAGARAPAAASDLGYYRFPTLRGNTIVFTAEGDLWTVPASGGEARRLTTHLAEETHPAISPDGRTLAFTAGYDGPAEVYTMPIEGGVPTRHTWDGLPGTRGDLVLGWTTDGRILYSTTRYSTLPETQLATLDPSTGRRSLVPLAQASDGAWEDATGALYFTRFAKQSSNTRDYRGGTAQGIWVYGGGGGVKAARGEGEGTGKGTGKGEGPAWDGMEAVGLTGDYPGTSKTPMPWGGRIYFASDRDGVMNLWSMDREGKDLKQLTHHEDFEVQWPAMDDGRIVYQDGADLWLLDVRSGQDRKLDIRLPSDFDQLRARRVEKPMEWLTSAHLSPHGNRVVLTARGQVFVTPAKAGQGRLVEATRGQDVRYRDARFLPDGGSLLTLSDESGEVELWRLPADGVGGREQLTTDGTILRWEAVPSPDGRWIAHTDKDQRLWVLDAAAKTSRKVAESAYDDFRDLAWSPDSRWLAYVEAGANQLRRVVLYDTKTQATTPVTTDRYSSFSPVWSPDGKWLWLLSDRTFDSAVGSPWGAYQPEPFFDERTKVYALALEPDETFPMAPRTELMARPAAADANPARSAESESGGSGRAAAKRAEGRGGSAAAASPKAVAIRLAGLAGRLYEAPIPAGDYRDLSVDGAGKHLLALGGKAGARTADLVAWEISPEKPKPKTLAEGVRGYELSADGRKVLVRKGDALYVVASDGKEKLEDGKVDLSGWSFRLDPREELRQMYGEAWRLERDYYWDPAMRGLDWKAIRAKYRPLAERATDREELSDVFMQMIAELRTLHMFVYGGDVREGEQVLPASLGARLERDSAAGGYRVAHIYRADPDQPEDLAPLARAGVGVREGDVITAVNGVATLSVPDIGGLLEDQAGKQVLLEVRRGTGRGTGTGELPKAKAKAKAKAGTASGFRVVVEPITPREEADLRYSEWEYTRRLAVDSLGGGKLGYVHLRAMGSSDIAAWYRQFYPVFDREGLVIDARSNRGGNIESWILEKLMRKAWMYWQGRVGAPYWNMQDAFRGPVVVLVNENTASDGELFAAGFQRLGLGKVIGTRTWGGEIWLSSSNVLVDRGIATAAENGVYGPDGVWLIEGHGVDPDMVVDDPPAATFQGRDAQLDAAVKYLEQQIREHPPVVPKAPARPPVH